MDQSALPGIAKVICIGASAGGLEATKRLLSKLPNGQNVAYVIIQHQKPSHKSLLSQLLAKVTEIPVEEVQDNQKITPGLFICPSGKNLVVKKNKFKLEEPESGWMPTPSIDKFLLSVTEHYKEHAWGVILSGTGSDGTHGIRAIKSEGGIVFVQSPKTADYDGMPRSAIETGLIDFVLSPEEIGQEIEYILNHPTEKKRIKQEHDAYVRIINLLSTTTKCDFSEYKRGTIQRRIERRMVATRKDTMDMYAAYVEQNPHENKLLFKDLLIGVTAFYREPNSYKKLSDYIRTQLENKNNGDEFRVWVAGCSTGEEAYSIAIMMKELVNASGKDIVIQVFATDLDEESINYARRGIFSPVAVSNLDSALQERYMRPKNGQMEVVKSLRESIIFSMHNMVKDPPFVRLDLISCRNVLIYFNNDLQKQVLGVFHYALYEGSMLFLGKSETISSVEGLFSTVDGQHRIYKRLPGHSKATIDMVPKAFRSGRTFLDGKRKPVVKNQESSFEELIGQTLFNFLPGGFVVVNDQQDVLYTRGELNEYMQLPVGEMNANLYKMAHEEIRVEIRALFHKAQKEQVPQYSQIITHSKDAFPPLQISVFPVTGEEKSLYLVSFTQKPRPKITESKDAEVTSREYVLEQELAATREYLQTVIEELETSNEELQSLNEEMQASNEELQASNEELETSNEELQATNEELQSAYAELKMLYQEREEQRKNLELSQEDLWRRNLDLEETKSQLIQNEKLLSSVHKMAGVGICVNDSDLNILQINQAFEEMFGYAEKELKGASFFSLFTDNQRDEAIRIYEKHRSGVLSLPSEWSPIPKNKKPLTVLFTVQSIQNEADEQLDIVTVMNITERKLQEENLHLVAKVFENTIEGIVITDQNQTILQVNEASERITGYSKEELIGDTPRILKSDWHDDTFYRNMWASLEREGFWQGEIWDRKKSGELYAAWITILAIRNSKLEITNYIAISNEITDKKEQEERIRHLAYYDTLTGLPNRALFIDRLEHALERNKRHRQKLAVVFLDLDRFKVINDSYGHQMGDKLLRIVSNRIDSLLRSEDTLARLGGDEFVLILEDIRSQADVVSVVERMREDVALPVLVDHTEMFTSASIGISIFPDDGVDAATLIKHADTAMYKSKEVGKNTYRFFMQEMNEKASRQVVLEAGLRKAVEKKQFSLVFQPQIDMKAHKITGIETLVRWRHSELGDVSPMEFIPLAEENSLIFPIGEWVLKEACRQYTEMQKQGVGELLLGINVSAAQFHRKDMKKSLLKICEECGIAPDRMEIEITESAVMMDVEETIGILKELKEKEFNIAIDDFGTGYSSLSYLKRLPVDRLKIDRSFVMDLEKNEEDKTIVNLVIGMSGSLGLKVIGEGVETETQAEYLLEHGCHHVQGYLYAKPMPMEELICFCHQFKTDSHRKNPCVV